MWIPKLQELYGLAATFQGGPQSLLYPHKDMVGKFLSVLGRSFLPCEELFRLSVWDVTMLFVLRLRSSLPGHDEQNQAL